MRHVIHFSVLLALGASILPAAAQEHVAVGDPKIEARFLRAGTEHFEMYTAVEGGAKTLLGTYVVSILPPSQPGAALMVIQVTDFAGGTIVDTAWVDAETLAPRRQVSHSPRGLSEFAFNGPRVQGVRPDGPGGSISVDELLPSPSFSGSLAMLMLRVLPLSAGYIAEIPFYTDPSGFVEGRVEVIGEDELPGPDGSVRRALRLTLTLGPTRANVWIDPDTRDELRTESTLPGGSTFIMVPARPGSDEA